MDAEAKAVVGERGEIERGRGDGDLARHALRNLGDDPVAFAPDAVAGELPVEFAERDRFRARRGHGFDGGGRAA